MVRAGNRDGYAPGAHASMRKTPGKETMPSFLLQALCETLWPTRCALCDAPGEPLCARCLRSLRFVDFNQCCPACGSPWGRIQCDVCNPVARARKPFAGRCVSCLEFEGAGAAIVKTYKDKGDRALCGVMAALMASTVPPSWTAWAQAVTFVPATKDAVRRRGFDHAALLAEALARDLGLPCLPLIEQAQAADQRALGRRERLANMEGRFRAPRAAGFRAVIVVDDVMTTGATLAGAVRALSAAHCAARCITFARV